MSQPQGGPYGPPQRPAASFDLKSIMPGGLIVLVGAVVYLIFSFFPWYGGCDAFGLICITLSAWDSGVASLSVILFLVAAAAVVVTALQVVPPRVPMRIIVLGVVVLGDIFFLISLAATPYGAPHMWGTWVGLVLCIVITVGAVLEFMKAGGISSLQRGVGRAPGGPPPGYPQQQPPQQPQQPQQPPVYPPQGPA